MVAGASVSAFDADGVFCEVVAVVDSVFSACRMLANWVWLASNGETAENDGSAAIPRIVSTAFVRAAVTSDGRARSLVIWIVNCEIIVDICKLFASSDVSGGGAGTPADVRLRRAAMLAWRAA